tara:strand:- start:4239 stop:5273 length:1035 start_codon:yes stop_codon:yes gene_type:complete
MINTKTLISGKIAIKAAVKKLNQINTKSLFVEENKKIIGVFTEGDFRNSVLKGIDINDKVKFYINKNFKFLNKRYTKQKVKNIFKKNEKIHELPVLNRDKSLIKILSRKDFFIQKNNKLKKTDVIIMAGGKGTRLQPFTDILPKALLPIGQSTILDKILNQFSKFGLVNFFITVNNKKNLIKSYIKENLKHFKIKIVEEKSYLGTAGSLKLIASKVSKNFFVSNCDILIEVNFEEIFNQHINTKSDLTIVSTFKSFQLPYGIFEISKKGNLINFKEKPSTNHLVNCGIYLMNKKIIKLIPKSKPVDMDELIEILKKKKMKIKVFPISEDSWKDFGVWDEYFKNK